jgi:hypothetical protein
MGYSQTLLWASCQERPILQDNLNQFILNSPQGSTPEAKDYLLDKKDKSFQAVHGNR